MLKAVTRQNRSAPQLAKRLSPTKDSLGAPSLKSVDEDVEVAIGSASQELLEQLQVFADEDEEKWEAMRQIVGLGLESISGSVLALISRIADELQLSLREKLKEGIKANEEKLDRARKAGEIKVEEVKADYRGRELSQLEIEQKIVERILSAVGAGSGEEKDGEQGKILHEAFARQAELLAEISKLTNLNGELRDANGEERQMRAKAEKSFEEANYQLQRSEDELASYQSER